MACGIKDEQYRLGGAKKYYLPHLTVQLSMNRVLCNRLLLCSWLFLGLLLNCETPIKRNEVIVETLLYFKKELRPPN